MIKKIKYHSITLVKRNKDSFFFRNTYNYLSLRYKNT